MLVRLQKFLAEAGVASRRTSEQLITAGQVEVNGRRVDVLGTKVDPQHDRVAINGRPVKAKRKLYVALHKPRGYICSRSDPEGRQKIGDLLPREWTNLYSVGRLDFESEGLLFLTNDGDFCLRLTHPRYAVPKRYLATIEGRVRPEQITEIGRGIFDAGERLAARRVRVLRGNQTATVVELELAEGKNREVRRIFEALGLNVKRLQRTQIGPIKLGTLPAGKWRILTGPEIKTLLRKYEKQ